MLTVSRHSLLVAGLKANAGPIAYSASKAAVVSTAQTSAFELAGQNIRVNAICPGLIEVCISALNVPDVGPIYRMIFLQSKRGANRERKTHRPI